MTTAAQPKLFGSTAEKEFKRLTSQRYEAMVRRFSEKRDKNQRIIRHGRVVPFNLKQFQAWVLEKLGGKPDGATRCCYDCGTWISVQTMRVDHLQPIKQGGTLGFNNLGACCERCNKIKGGVSVRGFLAFMGFLKTMLPGDSADVLHRLEISVSLAAGRSRFIKKQQSPTPTTPTPQQEISDEF